MAGFFAYTISTLMPPVYEARSVFYLPHPTKTSGASDSLDALTPSALLPFPEEKSSGVNLGILRSKDIARAVQSKFPEKPLDFFIKKIDFKVSPGFAIEVYVRDRDPNIAALIANAYPKAFDDFQANALSQRGIEVGRSLRAQLEQVKQDFDEKLKSIEAYQAENLIASSEEAQKQLEIAKNIEQELKLTQSNMSATKEHILSIEQQMLEEKKGYKLDEEVASNPQIDTLKQKVQQLEISFARAKVEFEPSHWKLQAMMTELDAAKKVLKTEIVNLAHSGSKQHGSVFESLRAQRIDKLGELKYLEAKIEGLSISLSDIKRQMQDMVPKFLELEAQQSEKRILENLQSQLEKSLQNVTMQNRFPQSTIVILEHATPPERPAFPMPLLNTVVSMIFGLVVGVYYVLFLDYLSVLQKNNIKKNMDITPLE